MGLTLAALLVLLRKVWTAQYDCIFEAPDGIMYDLSAMKRASPPDYMGKSDSDPYEYRCNVCHSTLQSCAGDFAGIATQWNAGGSCIAVLGRENPVYGGLNRPTLEYLDEEHPEEGVSLVYYNGDLCYTVVAYEREIRYNIRCDKSTKAELVSISEPSSCKYVFEFKSKAACLIDSQDSKAKRAAKKAFSPKKYLLWAGAILALYFFLGSLYNRRTQGTDWISSMPNKEFWLDLPALVSDGVSFSLSKLRSLGSSQSHLPI